MFVLLQKLVAFKYSCKLNHWKTDKYCMHLLFDRLQEDMDDKIDDVAEKYFMAHNKKQELNHEVLNPTLINHNLVEAVNDIIAYIYTITTDDNTPEAMISLLDSIAEEFTEKLALLSLEHK